MPFYRFVTPHRAGKWYPDLLTAQRHAFAIGAGFLEESTGRFMPYKDTRLEVNQPDNAGDSHDVAA